MQSQCTWKIKDGRTEQSNGLSQGIKMFSYLKKKKSWKTVFAFFILFALEKTTAQWLHCNTCLSSMMFCLYQQRLAGQIKLFFLNSFFFMNCGSVNKHFYSVNSVHGVSLLLFTLIYIFNNILHILNTFCRYSRKAESWKSTLLSQKGQPPDAIVIDR